MRITLRCLASVLAVAIPLCLGLIADNAWASEEKLAIVGGTIINPATAEVLSNSTIVIAGGQIVSVSTPNETKVPASVRVVDARGKFILPGYVDTHVHFFQSGDLYTRTDIVDLNRVLPYKEELAWIKSQLDDP